MSNFLLTRDQFLALTGTRPILPPPSLSNQPSASSSSSTNNLSPLHLRPYTLYLPGKPHPIPRPSSSSTTTAIPPPVHAIAKQAQQIYCELCQARPAVEHQVRCATCNPNASTLAFFAKQGLCIVCERSYAIPGEAHCESCRFRFEAGTRPTTPPSSLSSPPSGRPPPCVVCSVPCAATSSQMCAACSEAEFLRATSTVFDKDDEQNPGPPPKMCGCGKKFVRRTGEKMCEDCFRVYVSCKTVLGWAAERVKQGWPAEEKE